MSYLAAGTGGRGVRLERMEQTLWLLANGASGSNDPQALTALQADLAAAGSAPARVIDISEEDLPNRAALEAAGVSTLAIFTGDGTANTAISALEGWAGDILILPGGTSNLLSRALHGEMTAAEIVAAYGRKDFATAPRNVLRCSAGIALCEILAGPGATWGDVREELRDGTLVDSASKALDAARASSSGPMVLLTAPVLGREEGYAGIRLVPGAAGVTVDGYAVDGVFDYLRQGVALLRRDFREGPHDELGTLEQVTCRSADGTPIELLIDGERRTGQSQERFSLAPLAVNLLACPDE